MARFTIMPLTSEHDRKDFSCGIQALDNYFHNQVSQDIRRRVAACYVAIDIETNIIAGFYTLSAGSVPLVDMPEQLAKRLPRYQAVPVARLGRLAVHNDYRRQRLGAALLWDAIMKSVRSELAVFALIVDAKDEQVSSFYHHHGFLAFGSLPNQMIYPLTNMADGV